MGLPTRLGKEVLAGGDFWSKRWRMLVTETCVFGLNRESMWGDQHEASHLEEKTTHSSPNAIRLAPQSLANIWKGYQETQRSPDWRSVLPLYFLLQIEKQNRHQGYIYITVFKMHFLLPSAAHDKSQVFF